MKKMRYVAAPVAAVAITVAGAGAAAASPLAAIAGGAGTGMGIGGSLGKGVEMSLGMADGGAAKYAAIAPVVGKILGGSIGVLTAIPEALEEGGPPLPELPFPLP